ncbi:uncharacterized protein B0H18DRAFT_938256 [Fomitopsis serialis]|uniref:uncharacterized protein n=1 Tax=Fomitopsis serialis TaxID=139415 RepID=UPI002008B36B|nr:uncharacterized protein B0H18DRAFT_938256 [Neoantrodia serialis]KAH9917708.1 hypothetical protein B0H18DRAFT_938256 [Neoantrodia serialis]
MKRQYHRSVCELADKDNGWHLGVVHMKAQQVLDFRIEDMAARMRELAPELWELVSFVLSGNELWAQPQVENVALSPEEVELWEELGDPESSSGAGEQRAKLRQALCRVQCNALAAVNGIFFHSCNAPDKVIKALAHMGITISPSSINNAVRSLSIENAHDIRTLGQSLEAMFAYDNLELTLNTMTPTIEQSGDRLVHLTSGLIMKLEHGVTAEDLRCSRLLWQTSRMNPAIPVTKLKYHPVRAMNINQSRVDGNIEAIADIQKQAGIGDPTAKDAPPDTVDISEYVTIIHGDLGTGECVQAIQKRRSIEDTELRRYQSVVFAPGIFHTRMACVDNVYRVFIQPTESRVDDNSLMKFVGKLRPKETGQIGSKPKFRQMHEVVLHAGIVLRLDCWRTEARRQYSSKNVKNLADFAAQKPTFAQLVAMAHGMVRKYVAGKDNLFASRRRTTATRDQQYENITLMHQYFSLYEEFSWRANAGDIGGLEAVMISWIPLWKATGKHKYAAHMVKFLTDVHFVYPERLRHAIRYNLLVNPTGKAHAFRGVDWVVELINLFTKDTYGGDGSNFTKDRVITESPNVLVYRSCARNAERNFYLCGLSSAHGKKDMTVTYNALLKDMDETAPHEYRAGRKSAYCIPNMLDRGIEMILGGMGDEEDSNMDPAVGGVDSTIDAGDISVDVEL